jgi:hypothetical protein
MTSRTIVLVEWADAHTGDPGWLTMDDYQDDGEAMVSTVGFLVPVGDPGSKKDHVTVWQTISEGDGIAPMHIPAAMVRRLSIVNRGDTVPCDTP